MIQSKIDISPGGLLDVAPKIVSYKIHHLKLPKSDPTWRFALAANPASPGFLLQIFAVDGSVGAASVGEIQHLGYQLSAMSNDLNEVLPVLVESKRADAIEKLSGPSRALVQMALLDLVARSKQIPVHELLGTTQRQAVRVTRILSLKSPEQMARIALSHKDEGYRDLKIKLDNNDADLDFARVAEIRGAVGPDFNLTIDANQSYNADEALSLVNRIAQFNIDVFEQPVPQGDIKGMKFLRERSPIPIEADEAASSLEKVAELVKEKAVHGVSIKIPKLGGIDKAIAAIQMCIDSNVQVRIGAHVGSRLLSAAALQLAVVITDLVEPAELAEFERLEGDPVAGLVIKQGKIHLPGGPGYGVRVVGPLGNTSDRAATL